MEFKVGDIVGFKDDQNFREWLVNKPSIVVEVRSSYIKTKGYGWDYTEYDIHDKLTTRQDAFSGLYLYEPLILHKNIKNKFKFVEM